MFTALAIATISIAFLLLIVDLITTLISGYIWFVVYVSILIGFILLFVAL